MKHQAFDWELVIERLSFRIECIDYFSKNLLIGTAEGVVLVCPESAPDRFEQKALSRKPISQLFAVETVNVLVVLTDAVLSIHDLPSFGARSILTRSKGCMLFAIQEDRGRILLAASVKKKIQLYEWDRRRMDFVERGELSGLSNAPKSMSWCGDSLFVGSRSQYDMFNARESVITKIFPTGRNATSLILPLPGNQMLLAKDNISILVGPDGKPRWRHGLAWAEDPVTMVYSYPYVVALLSKFIEVREFDTHEFVQTITLSKQIKTLISAHVKHTPSRVLCVPLFVASQSHVWRLQPVPLIDQVDEMVEKLQYENALSFCERLPVEESARQAKLLSIHTQYAFHLFYEGKFAEAMQHFEVTHPEPEFVLGLYPKMVSDSVRMQYSYPDVVFPELSGDRGVRSFQALIDFLLARRAEFEELGEEEEELDPHLQPSDPNAFSDPYADEGVESSRSGAPGIGDQVSGDSSRLSGLDSLKLSPVDSAPDAALSGLRLEREPSSSVPLTMIEDYDAKSQSPSSAPDVLLNPRALSGDPRGNGAGGHGAPETAPMESPRKRMSLETKELIDTSILKAYLVVNDAMIVPFLRDSKNYCNVAICEKILLNHQKFSELVLLYRTKGKHRSALDLLLKLGQGPADGPLHGPEETVRYLRHIGAEHMDLVKEFSKWVLTSYPQDGLQIFTSDAPGGRDVPFPRDLVYEHLKQVAPSLCLPYLEWVIANGEISESFHNEYVATLLRILEEQMKRPRYGSPDSEGEYRAGHFIGGGMTLTLHGLPRDGLGEFGGLGEIHRRLLEFLETSKYYSPERMLVWFSAEELLDARAVLLSRLRRYDQALEIYVRRLHDVAKAEEVCDQVYRTDESEEGKEVYLALLRVFLGDSLSDSARDETGESNVPLIDRALALLESKFDQIDPIKALELLPNSLLIHRLHPLFEKLFRRSEREHRDNQVIMNILKSKELQMNVKLIHETNHSVVIDESVICQVCQRRIATRVPGVFAWYPNGKVVHFSCAKGDFSTCPVTGKRFP